MSVYHMADLPKIYLSDKWEFSLSCQVLHFIEAFHHSLNKIKAKYND